MVLRTTENPQFHFDKVIDVPVVQVVRAPQVRRGEDSRAPTVAPVEKLVAAHRLRVELKWGFLRPCRQVLGRGPCPQGHGIHN